MTDAGGAHLEFGFAGEADVDEVVALVQSAYRGDASRAGWTTEADIIEGQRVDREMVLELLAEPDAVVLTARAGGGSDGRLVACCELRHKPDRGVGYLGMFAVEPTIQGGGLGRRVLAEAERVVAARWGATRVEMTVIDVRYELIAWYRRRGYQPTGDTGEFPYGDERFGLPTRPGLAFVVLAKDL